MSDVTFVDLAVDAAGDTLAVDAGGDSLLAYIQNDFPPPNPPVFTQADYLFAMQALMPRGRVWPRSPGATQTQVLAALAASFWRVSVAAGELIQDAFPSDTDQLLPEWQATLGLPDPCIGPPATLAIAQAQVIAQFANAGGQSIAFFVALAAQLGYAITITEFTGAQAHHWQVNAPGASESFFHVGINTAGQPLSVDPNTALECIFNRLKPGHTTVSFVYGG
jgi:uncharacterized protein YmfQ (DUF2313 family)